MRIPLLAAVASLFVTTLTAQFGKPEPQPEEKKDPNDPAVMIADARPLIMQKKTDDAIVLLWRALDRLAASPGPATNDAVAAARTLLKGNDPCDAQRQAAFSAAAKQLVEMAAGYRGKKWLDTATQLLDTADRLEPDAGSKERPALDAAKGAREKDGKPCPLLVRKSTRMVTGYWRDAGECLEALQHAKEEPPYEWISNTAHKDNEMSLEFRGKEPGQPYAAGLWVGFTGDGDGIAGFRIVAYFDPATKEHRMSIWDRRGSAWTNKGMIQVPVKPVPDGFHRLVVQVAGARIRATLDDSPVLEYTAGSTVRGDVGVSIGRGDVNSCPVFVRNLMIEPLPHERPAADNTKSAEEQAALAVAWAIDGAKEQLGKKQPEPACHTLRDALGQVAAMAAGEPRVKAMKTIDQMLAQADPLAAKTKKSAQAIAAELVKAADQYAAASMPRAALMLVERAAAFDPEGTAARLATAQKAAPPPPPQPAQPQPAPQPAGK